MSLSEPKKSNYLGGAAILAATVALTKIIGMIYKIPLYNLLGDEGTTHFQLMYTVYSLLLTISTAGIPVALSRLISAAHATGKDLQVEQYFCVAKRAFIIVGLFGMAVLLVLPRQLANFMGDPEISNGLMALAPAVFFACLISVYRGYTQGFSNMVPTAISQIMEVLSKLVIGLAVAWVLAKSGATSANVAAGAIIGVTVGLGLAVPVLMRYVKRMKKRMRREMKSDDRPLSARSTLGRILRVSIPITLSSSLINITTLIDSKLVLSRLQAGAGLDFSTAKVLYGAYSKGLTLFTIPSAFIVPITVSVVPAIAAAIAKEHHREARDIMESSIKLTTLFALPAAIGMCVLSYPIYNVLYPGSNARGPGLLALLAIASFFVCAQLITNSILQASGHEKLALLSFPVGGIVMIVIDWVLVGLPEINITGSPIGTICCYAVTTLLNIVFICIKIKERPRFLRVFVRPAICTAIMGFAAWGIYNVLHGIGPLSDSRFGMLVCLAVSIVAAVIIYFVLIILLRAVTKEDMKFIPKGEKIAKLLHIR